MPTTAATEWLANLARLHVLEAHQFQELRPIAASTSEPKRLAHELIQRGWLSVYQANLLLQNRGEELLLDSYVLIDKLGEGGMGAVFRARNWKLGRISAVKLIRKERLGGPDAVRRFQREMVAAAALEHPNVVRAYDAGEVNGTHFFAMEYVDGVDLARLVQQHGPLPPRLACEYICQAALGLQHAHERGMVHRDIKPANLLLARGSGSGVVKILDMGLARLNDRSADEDSGTLTQVGMVMGTPDFMAPEQSLSARTVDIRADLYGLGCSLYFLLTGTVPFPGGSLTEKLLRHQLDQPTPIEMLRPEVPEALANLVYRLMAKKPEERLQTPRELADALQALLAGQAILTVEQHRPTTSGIRAGSPRKREVPNNSFWAEIVDRAAPPELAAPSQTAISKRWLIFTVAASMLLAAIVSLAAMNWPAAKHPAGSAKDADAKPAALPLEKARDRFVPLFNANDLQGFKVMPEVADLFRMDNGVLLVRGKPNGYLLSEKRYRNFELSYEIKHPREWSNSGVFLHLSEPHMVWPFCIECQGMYRDLGRLFAIGGARGQFIFDKEAHAKTLKPVGDWNHVAITSAEGRLVSKVNGVTVSEGASDSREGAIGFQSEWSEVQFRNVRIAEPPVVNPGDGFVPLFNGRDLTGWKTLAGPGNWINWKVENGAIMCTGTGYLISERNDFADFHLRVEAKVNRLGNGGIYFRVGDSLTITRSYEAQISSAERAQRTGSLYNRVKVTEELVQPDTWFTYEIIAEGPQIRLLVDGRQTVDYKDARETGGCIVLQHLAPSVHFRKVEIKELKRP